jgi:membrane protease YdiL (CAAX protease family)
MLFRFKNTLRNTLLLTFTLFIASVLLQQALGLKWDLSWQANTPGIVLMSLVVLLIGDGVLQGVLRAIYGREFQNTFNKFLSEVVVGEWEVVLIVALTAATEEMFFRGVLTQGILQMGWGAVLAVILSSFIFNLSHYFQRPDINLWLLTSIWEGLVLAVTYVLTGSLIAIMVVHAIHDVLNGGIAIVLVRQMKQKQPVKVAPAFSKS